MRRASLILLALMLVSCRGSDAIPRGYVAGPLEDQPRQQGIAPLASLGPDGLRVTIDPSSGDYEFIVDFSASSRECHLVSGNDINSPEQRQPICGLVAVRYSLLPKGGSATGIRHYSFLIPEEEFRDAVANFDWLADRWHDLGPNIDGTAIGVERYRRGQLRSLMSSGIEPGNPAFLLGVAVHRILLAYGPAGTVPRRQSFIISSDPYGPCEPTDFAAPDPDGFGTGNDICARQRAARAIASPANATSEAAHRP